jgi:geranylgeranyl pyrophosphate synthase
MGMTGGQAIDLGAEGKKLRAAELESMYVLKTGALIRASILSAYLLADESSPEYFNALDEFSRDIGIAFQIRADILAVEGATEVIGKTVGSDERLRKATYPALFGVDASHERCAELLANGLDRLEPLGNEADSLRWLANYIVSRGN